MTFGSRCGCLFSECSFKPNDFVFPDLSIPPDNPEEEKQQRALVDFYNQYNDDLIIAGYSGYQKEPLD